MKNRSRMFSAVAPSLVIAATAVFYAWVSFDYSAESRAMPLAAAGLAMVLALLDMACQGEGKLARNLRRVLSGSAKAPVPGLDEQAGVHHPVRHEAAAFAWIIGFLSLSIVAGFYLAIPAYVFAYLRFYAGKQLVVAAGAAAALVAFLYTIFEILLGYEIFSGLIAGDFM